MTFRALWPQPPLGFGFRVGAPRFRVFRNSGNDYPLCFQPRRGCVQVGGRVVSSRRRGCAAFSLLELLIVVALLVVLTTLYWGPSSTNRQRAESAACQKNLQKLGVALDIFANDHTLKYPEIIGAKTSEEPLDLLVPQYTLDRSVFVCPPSKNAIPKDNASLTNSKISYAYFMGRSKTPAREPLITDRQINTLPKTAGQPVFSASGKPPGNNHGAAGGNILFTDGSVTFSPPNISFPLELPDRVLLLNPKP
jgi:prepilin-type N-terminal cleavage/methylation domain-containing protein/prepilin-type processing-associated H-X9-DG protein